MESTERNDILQRYEKDGSLRVALTESNGQSHPMIFLNDKPAVPM